MATGDPDSKIVGKRDSYCAHLRIGDTKSTTYQMSFVNPASEPHLEWMLRNGGDLLYTDKRNSVLAAASAISTFDHLLSDQINMEEATRRLRLLRAARRELVADAVAKTGENVDVPM